MFTNFPILNEYIWSALITFIAAFGMSIAPFAGSATFDQATLFALLSVGVRAGFSAVINLLATKFATISSRPR